MVAQHIVLIDEYLLRGVGIRVNASGLSGCLRGGEEGRRNGRERREGRQCGGDESNW